MADRQEGRSASEQSLWAQLSRQAPCRIFPAPHHLLAWRP